MAELKAEAEPAEELHDLLVRQRATEHRRHQRPWPGSGSELPDAAPQLRAIPGDVACTVKVVCRLAGKTFVVDEFKTEEMVATGSASESDIAAMLKSRHITPFVSAMPAAAHIDESIMRWLARR